MTSQYQRCVVVGTLPKKLNINGEFGRIAQAQFIIAVKLLSTLLKRKTLRSQISDTARIMESAGHVWITKTTD